MVEWTVPARKYHQERKALVCMVVGNTKGDGLGAHIATEMAKEGGRIVLVVPESEKQDALKVAKTCANIGSPSADMVVAPLYTKPEECAKLTVCTTFSRQRFIEVVVFCPENLGTSGGNPDSSTSSEAFDNMVREFSNYLALKICDRRSLIICVDKETALGEDRLSTTHRVVEDIFARELSPEKAKLVSLVTVSVPDPKIAPDWSVAARKLTLATHYLYFAENIESLPKAVLLGEFGSPQGNNQIQCLEELACMVTKHTDASKAVYSSSPISAPAAKLPKGRAHGVSVAQAPAGPDQADNQEEQPKKGLFSILSGAAQIGKAKENVTEAVGGEKEVLLAPEGQTYSGVSGETGVRIENGMMTRPTEPDEENRAKADVPGAVLTPIPEPANLEPEMADWYKNEPQRHPDLSIQCWQPFNGETPHVLMAKEYFIPQELHYVRNHLPVPTWLTKDNYKLTVQVPGGSERVFTLEDVKTKYKPVEISMTLQCAGNRRIAMAAAHLVEGRAPWNHGGIGCATFVGVRLRDVLSDCGLDLETAEDDPASQWVTLEGHDWDDMNSQHFGCSIPIEKAIDRKGDVLLAWSMNGQDLQPDHGFPLRMVVPGYQGARSVKWLKSIAVTAEQTKAPWQAVDYRPMPSFITTLPQGKEFLKTHGSNAPPLFELNVQSAILVPQGGSKISRSVHSLKVIGYAWTGAGIPIIRVDVTADGGKTWSLATIERQDLSRHGRAWAWAKWHAVVEVPSELRQMGGKLTLHCKAWDRHYNTQPHLVDHVWNFRGLATNAWHEVVMHVE